MLECLFVHCYQHRFERAPERRQAIFDPRRDFEAEIVRFEPEGSTVLIRADAETLLLVMTGEPIDEPVVGYGPFVMNSETQIREAIDDFNSGRMVAA